MHAVNVTAKKGGSDLTIMVVGSCAAETAGAVTAAAARIAAGKAQAPLLVEGGDGPVLLLQRNDAAWLVGGEDWRLLGGQAAAAMRQAGLHRASVCAFGAEADTAAFVEGLVLGDYLFTDCRSGEVADRPQLTVRLPGAADAVRAGVAAATAQNQARLLADLPANVLYPASFVKRVKKLFKSSVVTVEATQGLKDLERDRFPGLVTVGRGSRREPALLVLRYRPAKVKKKGPRLALVGKGVTFDTGGISLKPAQKMWEMKADMGGAAAVVGAMLAVAEARPAVPVTAYIGLAENMPDGQATRPGDIYQARNGTWIHVDNTDAEGRLVMSDLLTWACEEGATHLIDAATLTGAALIGLGQSMAAVMGRHPAWNATVREAGERRGEAIWELPLYGEYRQQLDHPHADLNNSGGRPAGTITAGLFLAEFVDPAVEWAHLDIAGPAMRTDGWRYFTKGMTGFGCRTLAEIARSLA